MFELIIIGGGPAGVAAGVYASRKQLKTLLITDVFGGQSVVSDGIENWIGEIKISGFDLAKKLENHLMAYSGNFVTVNKGERVESVTQNPDKTFTVKTNKGEYATQAVLVATGSSRRKLEALGADRLEYKGLTYCATCDGPLFADQDVAVIGGGNSALEGVAQLLKYCKSVTLVHRRDEFKADPVTLEAVKKDPKLNLITNAEMVEILGENFVSGFKYKDKVSGEIREVPVTGIFVEIGAVPATKFVTPIVDALEDGTIKIDPWNQRTNNEGIWAAGDCTNILYHQNNIAAGDAVRALEDIFLWIEGKK
jgi:alkyl hydroperoxide reductase subunit F